ncbi:MAG: hypothetical protein QOH53_2063, partial [Ilumatobacteraceae bacterium]
MPAQRDVLGAATQHHHRDVDGIAARDRRHEIEGKDGEHHRGEARRVTTLSCVADAPEILYARSGDLHIAYQVVGDGPVDLVYTPGIWSNLEIMWEWPEWSRYLYRLAAFSRLILFDMRGVGLSDRGAERPTLELQV